MTLSIVGWLALGEKHEVNGDNRAATMCCRWVLILMSLTLGLTQTLWAEPKGGK